MSTTLGIVEVSPRRLVTAAGRHSMPSPASWRIEGKPLLEWVVRRVTDAQLLDDVVVLIDSSQHDSLRGLTPADVSLVIGRQPDSLGRLAAVLRKFDAVHAVRIKVDSPFVDPELIDRIICAANSHPGIDYIGYKSAADPSPVHSNSGVFPEWCRAQAVYRADHLAGKSCERRESLRYLCSHPKQFQSTTIPIPAGLDRHDVRLAVHVEEDWEHAQSIVDALGLDGLDWHAIAGLLDEHPAMRQRMAILNQADCDNL